MQRPEIVANGGQSRPIVPTIQELEILRRRFPLYGNSTVPIRSTVTAGSTVTAEGSPTGESRRRSARMD